MEHRAVADASGLPRRPRSMALALADALAARIRDGRLLPGLKLPTEEIVRLCEEGRTNLIPGFMSKRGQQFGAFLVLSPTGAKAEFEFPPR